MTTRPVIVTAPPRSGTSCIAGMLHAAGIDMGEPGFPEPHPDRNPLGNFEDTRLREPSRKVATAMLRGDPYPTDEAQRFHAAFHGRSATDRPWGWKDPYLCVSAQVLLPETDALWILVDRPREETEASLRACGSSEAWIREALPVFYRGMERIERRAQHCRRVPYPEVVAKPHLWATTILGWVTLRTMYGFTYQEIRAAAGHVRPELYRHCVSETPITGRQ